MKTGIIIANTGSPAGPEPDDIEAYLREFLMDDRICQMPKPIWRYIVYRHILPKRKFTSSERYKKIWTPQGSPLLFLQASLARKVQERLGAAAAPGDEVLVRSGMSYGEPNIETVLAELMDAGCDRIALLPLYPQSAYSPTQAVIDSFKRARTKVGWSGPTCIIDNYHDHAGYLDLMAASIRDAGFDPARGDVLLCSLHAIPLKDERAGDTYRTQVRASADAIAQRLGIAPEEVQVGYQSVFGHNEKAWASPLSLDVLYEWRDRPSRVFFCNIGFSIDCLETLYDVPFEMRPALAGVPRDGHRHHSEEELTELRRAAETDDRFVWVRCQNDADVHADVIADVLTGNLAASSWQD